MFLIVGLGNPGDKYENTRHNAGFLVIDGLAKEHSFPEFKLLKKLNALISEGNIQGRKIILAKPQTFMNNSGLAVKKIKTKYKISPEDIIIINDDLDLPFGKIKIARNQGAAGHKGVLSVIDALKTKDFFRLRIGIENEKEKIIGPEKFVLQKFSKEEDMSQIIKNSAEAIKILLEDGPEKAMTKYNA